MSTSTNTGACCVPMVGLTTFALCYALLMWIQFEYVTHAFLFYDDNHLISMASLGFNVGSGFDRRGYTLLGNLGSIQVIQAAVLLFIAGTASIIGAILYGMTQRPALAIGVALILISYPFATDQGVMYVTATHPFYGGIFAFAALALFWFAWKASLPVFVFGILGSSILACLAVPVSPVTRLMLLAPVIWLVIMLLLQWPGWKRAAVATVAIFSVVSTFYLQYGVPGYHYAQQPGRVDTSPEAMLTNLLRTIRLIVQPIAAAPSTTLLLYAAALALVGIAMVLGIRAVRRDGDSKMVLRGGEVLAFCALCLVAAALVFGPGSVMTVFRPRYAVLSFLFAGTAVAAAVLWLVASGRHAAIRVAVAGIAILLVANVIRGNELLARQYGGALETHRLVKALVEEERDRWPAGAQVVVLTPGPSATAGFNHWSTWYLRALSRDTSLIGLVGTSGWVSGSPFVEQYADHGPDYHVVQGGRAQRLRMKGLERARPLYLYEFDEDQERFLAKDVVFVDGSISMVAFGTPPSEVESIEFSELTCNAQEHPFLWLIDMPDAIPMHEELVIQHDEANLVFDGSGAQERMVSIEPGTFARLSFRLQSHGEPVPFRPFTDTEPEMPLLSNVLRVFRDMDAFIIADRLHASQGGRGLRVEGEDSGALVTITGIEGCFMVLQANDEVMGLLANPSLSGRWRLGAGNRERVWHGEISDWRLLTISEQSGAIGSAMGLESH